MCLKSRKQKVHCESKLANLNIQLQTHLDRIVVLHLCNFFLEKEDNNLATHGGSEDEGYLSGGSHGR